MAAPTDAPAPVLHPRGPRLVDELGRTVMLRGMNLGPASKLPSRPEGATHLREGFYDHRSVSFVGRPLPLAEADEHLERLRSWGFSHIRLAITWEAVEHAGPGIYDIAYLDYIEELVRRIGAHGLTVQIDPHQDTWSRFTGGSGAPGWTLEAVGMDPALVHATGAAILHQFHGDPFPRMVWPTNATKLAAATMFTLFFGSEVFAPLTKIDGVSAQEMLQARYCDSMAQVAVRLRLFPYVLGYETMNEPHHGYIGHPDLDRHAGPIQLGESPTPFQSMLAGAGFPQEVSVHVVRITGIAMTGTSVINPNGHRLWRDGAECPWRRHGVWDDGRDGRPVLLRPGYFAEAGGRRADFAQDFYRPFANRFARALRSAHRDVPILVQVEVGMKPPRWGAPDAAGILFAPHWYDSVTLVMKRFYSRLSYDSLRERVVLGRRAIQRSVASQLRTLRAHSAERLGDAPVVIGETGIPFDLSNKGAAKPGLRSARVRAADRVMRGVEAALVSVCWWSYAAENEPRHGDGWNGEDFSVVSRGEDGVLRGRALEALVRPYPRATAGVPLSLRFTSRSGRFSFTFRHEPGATAPTEIYVPRLQYPNGARVEVSDGTYALDLDAQRIVYHHTAAREVHVIRIRRAG